MTEHITPEQLENLRRRTLTGAALLAVDDHLATCSECRAMAGSDVALAPLDRVFGGLGQTLGVAAHPAPGELADYLDCLDSSATRTRIESHLQICDNCRADVSDLSNFRSQIQQQRVVAVPKGRRNWLAPMIGIAAAVALAVVLFRVGRGPAQQPVVAAIVANKPWVVALNDGGAKVGLDPQGQFVAPEGMSASDQQLIADSLRSGTLTLGTLRGPGSTTGVLRGEASQSASFRVLTPVGTVVFSQLPELRWEAFPGATAYRVTVFDENFDEVASSPELQDTHWTITKALARGRSYAWQVTAVVAGKSVRSPQPPQPEARFKVLDAPTAAAVEPLLAGSHPSHLLIAARMASLGLKDEALAQLDALQAENPDAIVVAKMRESLSR